MKEEPASDRGRSFYTRLSEIVERMSTSFIGGLRFEARLHAMLVRVC